MSNDIFERFRAEREAQRRAILMDDETAIATPLQFDALAEYSGSFPSGVVTGKIWKRRHGEGWILGEYVDHPTDPSKVTVKWRDLVVMES